jgi:L-cysteine:1D-myo-inositol 2-amino-2-deoxy-alpha-D-glucopyranoside ligase
VISWPAPSVPRLPGAGGPVRLFDTSRGEVLDTAPGEVAGLYVCGITPYDATHIGHAATYVAFDLLHRAWLDAGHRVNYVQNVTDVDDPLLARAAATGDDWQALASRETARFTGDMTALGVLPPTTYLGVMESIDLVVAACHRLLELGVAYRVPAGARPQDGDDLYFEVHADPAFGEVAGMSEPAMLEVFAERGGDPDRAGKRHPLDALLWRAHRPGEPHWDGGSLGPGRPGWHIECTAIALEHLGMGFDVQGGGSDLRFPHHEMGASHGHLLTGERPYAKAYAHAGMVALDGRKMSKSLGNLVFVSVLRAEGVDPMAIRLAILAHHYREDWEWTADGLAEAEKRLDRWRQALSVDGGPAADETLAAIRAAVDEDLDAPRALAAVDRWVDAQLGSGGDDPGAPGVMARAVDALLGIRL